MIVICAWCRDENRPSYLEEKYPYTNDKVSHGICSVHALNMQNKIIESYVNQPQYVGAKAHAVCTNYSTADLPKRTQRKHSN